MRIAGGPVLRASISLVVIGLALAGSVGSGAAQYLPPQPPSVGYPPPASYPYPPYDAEAESYPPPASYSYPPYRRAEPPDRYPPPASYRYPAGRPRYPGAYDYSDAEPPDGWPVGHAIRARMTTATPNPLMAIRRTPIRPVGHAKSSMSPRLHARASMTARERARWRQSPSRSTTLSTK